MVHPSSNVGDRRAPGIAVTPATASVLGALTALAMLLAVDPAPARAQDADALLQQLKARRAVIGDSKQSHPAREKAVAQALDILVALTRKHLHDPRINQWRAELADLLLERQAETYSKRIVYEIASARDLDQMQNVLDQAEPLVAVGLPELKQQMDKLDNAPRFNVEEWDRLNAPRQLMTTQRALIDFFRAQLAWARGARRTGGAPGKDRKALIKAGKSVPAFFARFAKDPAGNPIARAKALLYLGWTYLFNNQFALAINQADQVINGPALPSVAKFEAYTLKARALRAAGRFGGSSLLTTADVRNWVSLCVELSKQQNRSTPSPAKRIWTLLPADARKELTAGTLKDLNETSRQKVVDALNAIIKRPDFYRAADFTRTSLGTEAQKLLARGLDKLTGPALCRFNRLAMEAGLLRVLNEARLGAMAVLDEQDALRASDPALAAAPQWRVFNLLARANTMIQEAIVSARGMMKQARDLEKQDQIEKANALRARARAEYSQTHDGAADMIADAGKRDEQARQMLEAVLRGDLMVSDPELEAQQVLTTQPGEVPTAAELKGMSRFRLRRMARKAYEGQHYEVAEVCYQEMLRQAEKETDPAKSKKQRSDALYDLARTYYFWGQKAEKAGAEDAPSLYLKGARVLLKLLEMAPDHEEKQFLLKLSASCWLKQPDVYSNPDHRDHLIGVLEELLKASKGAEIDENRIFLAKALYDGGKYREAADHFGKVSAASSHYDVAREYQCWAILDLYKTRRPEAGESDVVISHLVTLTRYAEFARKRAAELRTRPRPRPTTAPTTGPDAPVDPAVRMMELGATFKAEAGRLYYDLLKDEARALKNLNACLKDYPDQQALISRVRSYKIQILLDRRQYERAIADLLPLIKEDPQRAKPLTDNVLSILEKDFKRLRFEQRPSEARQKAIQAERFAKALVEQGRRDKDLPPESLVTFISRWARTLNWLDRHQEAIKLLEEIYVAPADTNGDGKIDEKDTYTTEADVLIELADARLDLGQYQEAIPIFGRITMQPDERFSALWWRALIGQNKCNLMLNEFLLMSHDSLTQWRDQAVQLARTRKPGQPDPRIPAWLEPQFMDVLRRLAETPQVQGRKKEGLKLPAAPTPVERSGVSAGLQILLLLAGGAGALGLVVILYLVKVNRLKRHGLAARGG